MRPELQALLAEVRLQPATLVQAPAGYGKTTLLTNWAAELTRTGAAVCWITLDNEDSSPAWQLAYLVRSFQHRFPQVGHQAWRILHSAADLERDWPLVAGSLFSDLQAVLTSPAFLILDDIHLVADGPITSQLLGYLLRAAPPMLHIVLSSRRTLTIPPLPRLRAEGLLVEVNQAELSLTRAEAAHLLERQGVTLNTDELELLLNRTEGWALSVQLAARALVHQPPSQRSAFLRTLESSQRSLFDYLASEVLEELPAELFDFLALAAIPDRFDAALLGEVATQPNAVALIARAQTLGLPLTALDEAAGNEHLRAYRFHPLWRQVLLQRAHHLLEAQGGRAMHLRFGHAFERRGELEAALKHYAAINATDEMARALRELAWPLVNTPQRETIRYWIEQLSAADRTADPELLHMWGWSQSLSAPEQAATAISSAAELYRAQGLDQRELRALSDLAALLFWEDRPEPRRQDHHDGFAAVCVRAVRAANRVRDTWARGAALVSVAALLYDRGRFNAALRVARQATTHPRNPFWQWLLALIVSSIYVQQGHPAAALATIDEALLAPQIDRDDRLRQSLLRQQALALYQLGKETAALETAMVAHRRLSDYHHDGVVGTSAAQLALMLLEAGQIDEALTYISRARTAANNVASSALLTRVHVLDAYAALIAGQHESAVAAAGDILRVIDTVPAIAHDYWMHLLLLLVFGESGDVERAAQLADELTARMQARGDGLPLVATQLYRAALARRRGDNEVYGQALRDGWSLAASQDYGFIPSLPLTVLHTAVLGALQLDLAPTTVSNVVRRQLPDQATAMLLDQLYATNPELRVRAIRLLGDLGAATAYPALRGLLKDRNPSVRSAAETSLERLVYRPPYQLRVRTLGAFCVWRGDHEIRDRDWRSVKARQLFQLLLVERGRMLPRDRIMDTLWPGLEMEAAANNLRVTLSRLTRALEPERPDGAPTYYIVQQGETYGLNTGCDIHLDAADFAAAVSEGRRAEYEQRRAAALEAYQRAIALYRGAFLPDSLYEDWSVVERERLALLFNDAALQLGALLLNDGQAHEAIGLAWRVLEHDQAQEEAYRLLMRAHAQLGERSTALRLYVRCVHALRTDLGVEPLPATIALYESLRGNGDDPSDSE